MEEIAAASMEQNAGIEQVNQALQQLNEVTQQNSALSEEMSSSSEELSSQAERLFETIKFFKVVREEYNKQMINDVRGQISKLQNYLDELEGEKDKSKSSNQTKKNEISNNKTKKRAENDKNNPSIINLENVNDDEFETY